LNLCLNNFVRNQLFDRPLFVDCKAGILDLFQSGRKNNLERKISQVQEQIRDIQTAEKEQTNYKKIFESIESFCDTIKQGIEHASFDDKRRIVELLVEEIVVTNVKVEIHHIIPWGRNANLQLDDRTGFQRCKTKLWIATTHWKNHDCTGVSHLHGLHLLSPSADIQTHPWRTIHRNVHADIQTINPLLR